jgi:hypothetical protein
MKIDGWLTVPAAKSPDWPGWCPSRASSATRTPARKAGLSPWEGKIARDVDSPLEGTGFEPSVPLLRKALLGVANRRRRHEGRTHLQV